MRLAIVLVLGSSAAYAGGHDQTFAEQHKVATDKVSDVVGFELPKSAGYTYVLTGRYAHDKYTMAGVLLLRCAKIGDASSPGPGDLSAKCQTRRVDVGETNELVIHGIVDLLGGERGIPTSGIVGRTDGYKKLGGGGHFPVLVLSTTHVREIASSKAGRQPSKQVTKKLLMISLADGDRGTVVLQDTSAERWPSRSFVRWYKLERVEGKPYLELVASERRFDRCKTPEPTEHRFKIDGRHYRAHIDVPAKPDPAKPDPAKPDPVKPGC